MYIQRNYDNKTLKHIIKLTCSSYSPFQYEYCKRAVGTDLWQDILLPIAVLKVHGHLGQL